MRRIPWQLIAALMLLVLLVALATLQYRWLGDVSEAERERMRVSLRTRATEFTQEFDAELTRTYLAFHVNADQLDADAAATLTEAYERWRSTAAVPDLIRGVYLLRRPAPDQLQRFDVERHTIGAVEWPAELSALRDATRRLPSLPGGPSPMFMADVVDSRTPALVISLPRVRRIEGRGTLAVLPDPAGPMSVVIVVFDRNRLQQQVVAPLVTKYFGAASSTGVAASDPYLVTIVRRDDSAVVFPTNKDEPVIDRSSADVTTGLFDLRMDELNRLTTTDAAHRPGGVIRDRVAITIMRKANGAGTGTRVLMGGGDGQGAWELRARHRAGSLDSIVGRSRRRNLAISLGVLGVLGASFLLVIASARRQQRLARQQMEFVAAVSHELRTPLAVIRSAGENLADGVVAEAAQVKRYGALVETEGRRLTAMVDRVMDFAGIASRTATPAHVEVDVESVIAEAVHGLEADARDRGVTIAVHPHGSLPAVLGDRDALRSAIQNIAGNAVKYSAAGASVEITAQATGAAVRIRVCDKGLGIDAADLPHIFKPFYRGRRALDAQVRGSGVGLSIVRHVVDSHQGAIHVDSGTDNGTTVTLDLPTVQPATAVAT